MADPTHAQQQKSGKPWSGTNKIPNINEFVANLDKSKADRDKAIDQDTQPSTVDKVIPHRNEKPKAKGKEVTDPVTGKQIVIADVGKEYIQRADNPTVCNSINIPSPTILPPTDLLHSSPSPMPT